MHGNYYLFDTALSLGLDVHFQANAFCYPGGNSTFIGVESEFERINREIA